MDRSPARISAGLRWVRAELEANLQLARQFVEQHAENRDDPVPLAKALALLHEVRGSSTLIQGYGVALLAEEMKQAVQDLSGKKLREPDVAYGAIVAACLQLADYLDALAGGGDDCAIILQPIINELRLARGKTLLSEEDLFVAQFNALALKLPKPESSMAPTAQIEGTRLAPVFSASLLNWFKDVESAPSLSRIGRIAEHMADASREQQLFQMWRTAAACVESLLSGGLDQSLEIKRQFGRAGQLLRILSEQGESVAVRHVTDLSYRLLFYVGRSRTAGPRVGGLRDALALNAWLPDPETVKARRARLRGPNTQLLARVSEELRADLAEVKDSIDVAIRAGGGSTEEFDATTQRLKRVADTLSVLGLSEESRALAQPLETLATGMVDPGNRAWNEFATAVLRVELSLDTALVRQLHHDPDAPVMPEPPSADYREGTLALYRESLVNLARLKSTIEAYLKTGDAHGLPEGNRLLDEVAAGLRIQGLTKAEELVLGIQRYMQSPEFGSIRSIVGGPERFADTIAATEYYLEARRDALPGSELILDDLGYRVRRLQEAAIASAQEGAPAFAPAAPTEPTFTDTIIPTTTPTQAPAVAGVPSSDVDPEIREVFLEESEEVLETMQRALPRWMRQPDERELLVEIRRAFHTLKGSGRMVGATEVGEFSFSIENLLNRALDRTIELTPPVIDTVRDAVGLLPGLLENFRQGTKAPARVAALADTAKLLASGRTPGESSEMMAVFRGDAAERIAMVVRWLQDQDRSIGEYDIPEPIVRAFHTLRGAALAVGAKAVGELAASLEAYLETLNRAHQSLTVSGLTLIDESVTTLGEWIKKVGQASDAPDARSWIDRVDAVRAGLAGDVQDAEAEEDRQLAEVFAWEALDLVQKFEADVGVWARTPSATSQAKTLKTTIHTLKGAAGMAGCAPIAAVAQALNLRLEGMSDGSPPKPGYFHGLSIVIEGLYGMLDKYREGTLQGNGAELVAMVVALDPTDLGATQAPPPMLVSAGTQAAPDPELIDVFLHEGEELLEEIEQVAPAIQANPTDSHALGSWLRALHTLKGSARLAGLAGIGELSHRLETLTEAAAHESTAGHEVFRQRLRIAVDGLHALLDEARGGHSGDVAPILARMNAIASVAPPPAEVSMPDSGAPAPDYLSTSPRPEMQMPTVIADAALEAALRELTTTRAPEARPAHPDVMPSDAFESEAIEMPEVAEPEAESSESAFEEPLLEEPILEEATFEEPKFEEPVLEPPVIETPAEPAFEMPAVSEEPESEPIAEAAAEPVLATGGVEPELAQIFAQEASELLHAIQEALAAWRADPSFAKPADDIQRALHTLKGGARISGLTAMGDVAHAMESEVGELQRRGNATDVGALQHLTAQLEVMLRMLDRVDRGDFAGLDAIVAASEPSVPVATVETIEPAPPPPAVVPSIAPELEAHIEAMPPPVAAPPLKPVDMPVMNRAWDKNLFWQPESHEAEAQAAKRETARVSVERLDGMLNQAGEISIFRSRLEENHASIDGSLKEMQQTITRVREQLRLLDIETEAQIAARGFARGSDDHRYESQFDPLEMDRYSRMQELSRALAESIADMASLHQSMEGSASEAEQLLQQQGRINTEVQQSLMGTLMVPFSRQAPRLTRLVRQTAELNGKLANVEFEGAESEMDRNVLERMTAPLEHLMRNSVVHGIETPTQRKGVGKPEIGLITVSLKREGTQLLIEVRDDGRGLDFAGIRAQAVKRGLMKAEAQVTEDDLARFIFTPGFSTATKLTQDAGRGIGMDVVASEVKQLGGSLEIHSDKGKGARFRIRLPLMLAVSQALVVLVGEERFAIPLGSVEGIARTSRESIEGLLKEGGPPLHYAGHDYRVTKLGDLVGMPGSSKIESRTVPAILIRLGEGLGGTERRVAVLVDKLIGNREIVSKAAGPILGSVSGVSGATILADGRVMLILDVPALVREAVRRALSAEAAASPARTEEIEKVIMVVDDSITMRRVAERLLTRNGYRVLTAKDGLDAMAQLGTESPAAMLLDIEMPRADGFEVAAFVRNSPRLATLPIIMITSRSGDKHREHARQLGVNRYMIKPYQEDELLKELQTLLSSQEATAA